MTFLSLIILDTITKIINILSYVSLETNERYRTDSQYHNYNKYSFFNKILNNKCIYHKHSFIQNQNLT